MDKLKPCPFCGGEVTKSNICQHSSYFQIDCFHCGASGPIPDHDYQDKGEGYEVGLSLAITAWNNRVEDKI